MIGYLATERFYLIYKVPGPHEGNHINLSVTNVIYQERGGRIIR
jgi:hypothetical protein